MIRLSAFADEIAQNLEEQIRVLREEGIHFLDLRQVEDTNVLDLDDDQVVAIQRALKAADIRVAAIGSPLGKVPIDYPAEEHLRRLDRALLLARAFDTPFVRIFSFYAPAGGWGPGGPEACRDEIVARLQAMTARARSAGVVLLHENDRDLYGDTIARCVDLVQSIRDPHFAAVLDPANFVQCGQRPYPDAYEALRPWLRCIHVKDAGADGRVTVAGAGSAQWPALLSRLRMDGYDGYFSLEPHLDAAGQYSGFSGPDRFREAAQAFRRLLAAS